MKVSAGSKSALVLLFALLALGCETAQTTAPASQSSAAPTFSSPQWWPPGAQKDQATFEQALLAIPTPGSLRAFHDLLGSEAHIAGTAGDERNINRLAAAFRMLGVQVQVHEFWAYLATPIDAAVQIVSAHADPIGLDLKERPLEEDRFSKLAELTIGFNAYSGSGDVTAEVVYANYGTKADFEKLKELGVDCTGKIVLARYGGNFRGYKAKFAEAAGAAGLIIYSDPDDSGYRKGVPYPEGGWANETYIQRGSIDALDYPGDPLTPGIPATKDATRLDPNSVPLPHIPVQPLGYGAAQQIMQRMRGTPLPQSLIKDWQGGLPFAYRLTGGPDLKVRLMVKQERSIKKTANVIGTLPGATFPDQQIIIGCHHDAWCCGAGDPLAGTILVLEAARSFAELARDGHPPARTLVFAAWGAEEYGIIGSTEYCEQNEFELSRSAVAYINLDAASMGPTFNSSSAPSLKRLIDEVTRDVPQARSQTPQSMHQAWLGDRDQPHFENLGGGSDHVGFYCHLGIPSCGFGGEGSAGTSYHSNYDTLAWYRKVVGEDYAPALMLTRAVDLFAARLANATVLPLDPVRYGADCKIHLEALSKRAAELKQTVDFTALVARADEYEHNAQRISEHLLQNLNADQLDQQRLRRINDVLIQLERQWLRPVDTSAPRSTSWFRSLYARSDPDSGYAAWMLPALREAVENRDPAQIAHAEQLYGSVFDRLAEQLRLIESQLVDAGK